MSFSPRQKKHNLIRDRTPISPRNLCKYSCALSYYTMLTEAQKKAMEENRRRALEKRAARQHSEQPRSNDNVQQSIVSIVPPSTIQSSGTFKADYSSPKNCSPKNSIQAKTGAATPYPGNSKLHSPASSVSLASKPSILFQLISRARFAVEAPFKSEMIEVFKKMPSRSYDAQTRKWSFALSDHQALFNAMAPFLSQFQLKPLPYFVLNIFRYIRTYALDGLKKYYFII